MLDHIGLNVADYKTSKAFYDKALAPLGYGMVMEVTPEQTGGGAGAGYGANGKPSFWLQALGGPPHARVHVAFGAKDRASVDAFYKAAMAAGATDNGPPGLRPLYHPNYYGAFVFDPDGNNVEAVCHAPE